MATSKPSASSSSSSFTPLPSGKRQYLFLYNLISFILWTLLLVRIALVSVFSAGDHGYTLFSSNTLSSSTFSASSKLQDDSLLYSRTHGVANVFVSSHDWVSGVQTVALLEVVHSLVGIVRAPVVTTAMQVASRLLLVWGVVYLFGERLLIVTTSNVSARAGPSTEQLAYLSMLLAWCCAECIRYLYFVFFLGPGQEQAAGAAKTIPMGMGVAGVPSWLTWLRYNAFYVLYPLGISGEVYLVYASLPLAKAWDVRYYWFLIAVLAIYVPGSYILYTHMMAQRRRVARAAKQGSGASATTKKKSK